MKKILSIVVACIMLFSLVACNNKLSSDDNQGGGGSSTTPATPTNVKISSNGLITWDAVEGAAGYVVIINGRDTANVTITSYQVDQLANDFTYSVQSYNANYERSQASASQTFKGKGIEDQPIEPDYDDVQLTVTGQREIHSGGQVQLKALVSGATDKSVVWSVVSGGDVISVDQNGLVTAKEVQKNTSVSVKATSAVNAEKFKIVPLTVLVRPNLTQDMLDAVKGDKVRYSGYVDIDVYTVGTFSSYETSISLSMNTIMDGTSWYSEYPNVAGGTSSIFCTNHNGIASLVDLNYMNQEVYVPLLNDDGSEIVWTQTGYYNRFNDLTLADFELNEVTWKYDYVGADKSMPDHIVESANPFDFIASGFSLAIEGDEIVGFTAVSHDDYKIQPGHRCVQTLYTSIEVVADDDESFQMPSVEKFQYNAEVHDDLAQAIQNMQQLTSYTVDFSKIEVNIMLGNTETSDGYIETVTDEYCHFVPYDITYKRETVNGISTIKETHTPNDTATYGYKKVSDSLYNSYYITNGVLGANRAFNGAFDTAKANFQFAPEIFRTYSDDDEIVSSYLTHYMDYYYPDGVSGYKMYQVDPTMCGVVSTLYNTVGNNDQMYQIFAANQISWTGNKVDEPIVFISGGYITDLVFWFNMGDYIYGVITMHFSDFDTAEISQAVSEQFDTYVPRTVPTQWSELQTAVDETETVEHFLETLLEIDADEVPFFGSVLNDTFGFVTQAPHIDTSNKAHIAACMYYDVPLDADYTIESSMKAVSTYLLGLGFTKNANNEYYKDDLWVYVLDNNLDFILYIWVNNPVSD